LRVDTDGKTIKQIVREIAGGLSLDDRVSGEEK